MILFINPISTEIHIHLLHNNNSNKEVIIERGDDFAKFPEKIIELLDEYPIKEIWTICGPGAFTRMRIITLCLNTIYLTRGTPIKGCHLFDLIVGGVPILQVNETEYIIEESVGKIVYRTRTNLENDSYCGYLLKNDFTEGKVFIQYKEDWVSINNYFRNKEEEKSLSPIYFKAPHITVGSKKNTSHS